MLVDLMGMERSDILTERIDAAIGQIKASQPNPADIEAAKGQQAQQAQQAQAQGAQQQQAAQSQHEAEMAAVTAHSQIEVDQAKIHGQMAVEHIKAQNALALQHMKDINALDLQHHDKATIQMRLSGSMDPAGVVDAEKKAGIDGKEPAPAPTPTTQPKGTLNENPV